jgi:hypothetical protein
VTTIARAATAPAPFVTAAADLAGFAWSAEVTAEPLPSPRGIAPYSAALEADLTDSQGFEATGRLILLHDPDGNPAWDGDFRLVTFARAPIDGETEFHPMRAHVGWSWLIDALNSHGAAFRAPSGTVTVATSTHFGGLDSQPSHSDLELRASWTPDLPDGTGLTDHVAAWQDLLRMMAGVPPQTANVVPLTWDGRR